MADIRQVDRNLGLTELEVKIRAAIGDERYQLWFAKTTRLHLEDSVLHIAVPNRFYQDWLEKTFQRHLLALVEKHFARTITLKFRIDPSLFIPKSSAKAPTPMNNKAEERSAPNRTPVLPKRQIANARYTFANLIAGEANEVAITAAKRLINEEGSMDSGCLFIHGKFGVGKTHLLRAIEHAFMEQGKSRVLCCSAEEFTNQFIEGYQNKSLTSFRRKHRGVDVLLLDDCQFFGHKRATQDELFHTVNSLMQRGAKIVFVADTHPRNIGKLSGELVTRLLSGLVVNVEPPTKAMRRDYIVSRLASASIRLPENVVNFLASALPESMHELAGAIRYLENYPAERLQAITVDRMKAILVDYLPKVLEPVIDVNRIIATVAGMLEVSTREIRERGRTRAASQARMLITYAARRLTPATYAELGFALGGIPHSTLISGEKKLETLVAENGSFAFGKKKYSVRDLIAQLHQQLGKADCVAA